MKQLVIQRIKERRIICLGFLSIYNWKKITVLVKGGTQATTHMYYTIVNKILRWDDKKSTKKTLCSHHRNRQV